MLAGFMRSPRIMLGLLIGITFWLYWPAGGFDAVYFDDTFFTEAPAVRSGLNLASVAWCFTDTVCANWHPVTCLSFVVMHQLFGSDAGAEHLLNALLHALAAGGLFLALRRLVRAGAPAEPDPVWRCALVAALFAWHPLRVESVAWIAERKDVLCGLFFTLTLWAYAGHVETLPDKSQTGWTRSYGLALVWFALGLMSKAMLVTVPCLLLLLDVWPLRRVSAGNGQWPILKRLVMEKLPFFGLTLLFCVVTFLVQQAGNATPTLQELPPGLRLENVIVSYWRYLEWTLWPAKLAAYYSFPYDQHFYLALWPAWQIGAGLLALVLVSLLCLSQVGRRPYLAVGWFWYVGTLVPVIGLVQVGGQGMADRYTYIPLIGPVLAGVWWLGDWWGQKKHGRMALMALTGLILAGCLWRTRDQLQFWKNTDALFEHAIAVTGENPRAEFELGLGLEHEGRLAEAMTHYRNAISSQPRVKEAYTAMARLLEQQGNWAEAEQVYQTMLTDDPADFAGHLGLANLLPRLGRTNEAATQLKLAFQYLPDTADALNNLAWTLATSPLPELRNGPKAVELAERACRLTHYSETIMVGTLGAAYAEAGRFDEAVAAAQKACALAAATGQTDLQKTNEGLLALYRQQQAYHESLPTTAPVKTSP
jgi:protein O-mannosyl-transferase